MAPSYSGWRLLVCWLCCWCVLLSVFANAAVNRHQTGGTSGMDYPPDKITQVLNAHAQRQQQQAQQTQQAQQSQQSQPQQTVQAKTHTANRSPHIQTTVSTTSNSVRSGSINIDANHTMAVNRHAPKVVSPGISELYSGSGGSTSRPSDSGVNCIDQSVYDAYCVNRAAVTDDDDEYEDCECECEDDDVTSINTATPQQPQVSQHQHMQSPPQRCEYELPSQATVGEPRTVYGSEFGVLFVWSSSSKDGRVGVGNEFTAAVKSIRKSTELPIYLAVDSDTYGIDSSIRDEINVIPMDFVDPPSIDSVSSVATRKQDKQLRELEDSDRLYRHMIKSQALVQGWTARLLPEYVLVLDVNVVVGKTTKELNLMSAFEPILLNNNRTNYDIAGCFESLAADSDTGTMGWGLDTSVLAVRASAVELMTLWLDIIVTRPQLYYSSVPNQQQGNLNLCVALMWFRSKVGLPAALMIALESLPKFRVFPLPNTFNFKHTTVLSYMSSASSDSFSPLIVNSHVYRYQTMYFSISYFIWNAFDVGINLPAIHGSRWTSPTMLLEL
jgi:hypothetical protein